MECRRLREDLQRCNDSLSHTSEELKSSRITAELQKARSDMHERTMRAEMEDLRAQNLAQQRSLADAENLAARDKERLLDATRKTDLLTVDLKCVHAFYEHLQHEIDDTRISLIETERRAWELEKEKADLHEEICSLKESLQRYEAGIPEVVPSPLHGFGHRQTVQSWSEKTGEPLMLEQELIRSKSPFGDWSEDEFWNGGDISHTQNNISESCEHDEAERSQDSTSVSPRVCKDGNHKGLVGGQKRCETSPSYVRGGNHADSAQARSQLQDHAR